MNGINITHQLQHWPKYDRYVIIATDGDGTLLGTVQLESWPAEAGIQAACRYLIENK